MLLILACVLVGQCEVPPQDDRLAVLRFLHVGTAEPGLRALGCYLSNHGCVKGSRRSRALGLPVGLLQRGLHDVAALEGLTRLLEDADGGVEAPGLAFGLRLGGLGFQPPRRRPAGLSTPACH